MTQQELKNLLARAAAEEWTELDLRDQQLTTLPPEIGELTSLRVLNLGRRGWNSRGNHLTILPPELSKLTNLNIVDLSNNRLTAIAPEIELLTGIKMLNLSNNWLTTVPPEIGRLANLEVLDLSSNQLVDVPVQIGYMGNLTSLNLSQNKLNSISTEISQLINLITLNLNSNLLTILPPEIGRLANLTTLTLSYNRLGDISMEVGQLVNLIALDLSKNQLTAVPTEIGRLANLTALDLSRNKLTTIPSTIGQLANLTTLDLSDNQLTVVPSTIGQLANLTTLDLSGNQLTAIPIELGQLVKLDVLDLNENQLVAIPSEIGKLTNLTKLYLYTNQLTTVPLEISYLANLNALALNNNHLMGIPPELFRLNSLETLDLSSNSLKDIPHEFFQLTSLIELSLWDNQLTYIPSEISQLTNLTTLDLSRNHLEKLPLSLQQLPSLHHLDLRYNPNLGISDEILRDTYKSDFILDSYFADRRPLREAKLLLVGEADVGKTALARRLLHNLPPNPDQGKTPGIDIHKWETIPTPDDPPLTLNIWDFGGQGVYQATHQFFFTHRSLYLVVISSRRGDNESRLHHWINLVDTLSDSAPIIIVANKQDQHRLTLDERALKAQYPNLQAVVATSCTVGSGIDDLRQTIAAALAHLPHLNDTFPTAWFGLKQRLEAMPRSYITYDHYCDYCQEAGIDNRAHQRSWVQVLHQLGVVLNFQDRQLTATHVLKPNWVTDGIYRILSDRDGDIVANGGILTYRHLDSLLDPEAYPPTQHSFIVGMMQKFELCFPLPHRPNQFLIPDLLPEQQPDLPQLGFTATASALRFQYHYRDLLPDNILPRFMVGMMTMLDRVHSWRSGAILQFEQNRALVHADSQNRKITVTILGSKATRRALLTSVRMQLAAIHSSFASLKVEEYVPIPTLPGQSVSYRSLCNLEARGIDRHYDPHLDVELDVKQLLAGIETPTQRRELQLLEQLNAQYNLEAVQQLCFKLGVDYENLEGETKSAKTRALVQLLGRLGRLDELAAVLERP